MTSNSRPKIDFQAFTFESINILRYIWKNKLVSFTKKNLKNQTPFDLGKIISNNPVIVQFIDEMKAVLDNILALKTQMTGGPATAHQGEDQSFEC